MNNMEKNWNRDRILLEKTRAGDETGFKKIFDECHRGVFNLCFHMLQDRQEAEDITQEVFLKAFRKINKFRGESKISTWLHRIAVNSCLNRLRRNKRASFLSLDFLLEKGERQTDVQENGPLERFTREEEKKYVRKAVDSLPKNQRLAVILNHYAGFSYQEISEIMGFSPSSVRSLLYRAKQHLQKKLA